jgi:hypothetical protein
MIDNPNNNRRMNDSIIVTAIITKPTNGGIRGAKKK